MIDVGTVDGGGDVLGVRMSKGYGGIEGERGTEEEVENGVWVRRGR